MVGTPSKKLVRRVDLSLVQQKVEKRTDGRRLPLMDEFFRSSGMGYLKTNRCIHSFARFYVDMDVSCIEGCFGEGQ
jgi:hypothetical protein